MRYRVVVTANAKANLRDYYVRAAELAPVTADRWLTRFEEGIQRLAAHPERCEIAPENDAVEPTIRQLLFGRTGGVFRVLFTVTRDEVRVLHIRRGVMSAADPTDLLSE